MFEVKEIKGSEIISKGPEIIHGKVCVNLPNVLIHSVYHGCGHGWIQVNKRTKTPVEMSYSLDPSQIVRIQNGDCLDGLGYVLAEDAEFVFYSCNFSGHQACFF